MAFKPLSVSARTEKGCIYFSDALLQDGFEDDDHYMVHEIVHHFQQCFGDAPTKGSMDSEEYLDNKFEQEGFKAQTKYLSETRDNNAAKEYVEQVLNHHEVPENKKNKRRKELLTLAHSLVSQGGMFEVPEKLFNAVSSWAKEVAASWVLYNSGRNFNGYNIDPKKYTFVLRNKILLNREARKYTDTATDPEKYRTLKVPLIAFAGQSYFYIDPLDIERLIDTKQWNENILIHLYSKNEAPLEGVGLWRKKSDEMFIRFYLEDIIDLESFHHMFQLLEETIHHEFQHVMQNLLEDISGHAYGMPPKNIYKQLDKLQYDKDKLSADKKDDLDPYEFQPRLSDEIIYFNYIYKDLTPEERSKQLKTFLEKSDFFNSLKLNPEAWKEAVKRFVNETKTAL